MKCKKCKEKAVFSSPNLCKKHFIDYFENKVKTCIKKYELIPAKGKICVATSGGKDSLVTLYLLNKFYPLRAEALLIDEGIQGYRPGSIDDMGVFCNQYGIKSKIISFKNETGKALDTILKKKRKMKACAICGTLRRYLLNKYSKSYSVIATGHNLDDESQVIIMNHLRNNIEQLSRLGPKTGSKSREGFVQRVKPLYFMAEKEIMAFSLLKGIKTNFSECPYAVEAYRSDVRDLLNELEIKQPGTKQSIIDNFLKMLPTLQKEFSKGSPKSCEVCGEPTSGTVCNACLMAELI